MHENILLEKTVMVAMLGMAAQWLAWRFKLPAIVLLSVAGILAGPVFGFLDPVKDFGSNYEVLIKLAVSIILFEGGLNLHVHELKNYAKIVWRLALIGIPVAWISGTLLAYYVAGLSIETSLVLASILVVTGPTVIMPLIRQTKLSPKFASILKWEGIVNDPLGALLAVLVFEFFVLTSVSQGNPLPEILLDLGIGLSTATALGIGAGYFLQFTFGKGYFPEFLKIPIILSLIIFVYAAANVFQEEAGLLAVTVFGFVLGNLGIPIIYDLRRFKEYITVLLVSVVFVILTAGLDPAILESLSWRSAAFFVGLLFLVRPLSIMLATARAEMQFNERLLLSWIAPRGVVAASVAGLFAPRMVEAGYADAEMLVPFVFATVFLTVILHGFSLPFCARKLGLSQRRQEGAMIVGASPWTTELAYQMHKLDIPVLLVDNSWHHLRDARLKGIPTYFGEVLSESSEETLDLSEIGYILSATDNDAYNSLVSSAFAPHVGSGHVFQLPLSESDYKKGQIVRRANRGRIAFGQNLSYEKLIAQYYQGWKFHKTMITKEFRFEDFMEKAKGEVEPILLVRKNQQLEFDTLKNEIKPEGGDILISFVSPHRKETAPE